MKKIANITLFLLLFAVAFSFMFVTHCSAETGTLAPNLELISVPHSKNPRTSRNFISYGNSSAILLDKVNSAELIEVDIFNGCFKNYTFDEKINVIHFDNLYFTYTDSDGNGWLWLFKSNNNPLPFNENDYEGVFYWSDGIIVLTDGFHEVDLLNTFNTSNLTIREDRLNPKIVEILLENQ